MSTAQTKRPERRTAHGTAAGVIDTISDAVTFVLQRPWLMIVPILIDLVLWLVMKVTLGPVIDNLIRLMETSQVEGSDEIIEQLRSTGDQVMVSDYLGAFVPGLLTGMSLDTVMGILMLFVAPEGFGVPRADFYEPWQNGFTSTFVPDSSFSVMMVWLGVLVLSSIALVLFRVPIARAVRGTKPTSLGNELLRSWLNFVLYLFLLVVLACVGLVPLALMAALVPVLGLSIAFVTSLALLIFGGLLGVYTLFVVDAMLIHRTSPQNGFRLSYAVGRAYFGQIARFALTSIFLMRATLRLWSELAGSAPGFVISLVGSAFVGTVLAAASMMYYTDRFRLVRAAEAGRRVIPPQNLAAK